MTDSLTIQPLGRFEAAVRPPGSKSLTNRALLLAALAEGESRLTNVLLADDTRVMIHALRDVGFRLELDEATGEVRMQGSDGHVPAKRSELFLGNAGTAMRFLTAACCLGEGSYVLDGVARMRQRPIRQLVESLRQLGAEIDYLGEEGYPPLRVRGTGSLRGGSLDMGPALSSQFISALLQIGPGCREGLTLNFAEPIISQPYVTMTRDLMSRFGVKTKVARKPLSYSVAGDSGYRGVDYAIEPDASNASYFLAAAAVIPGSRCTVEGLTGQSLQGDVGFADVLQDMGATVDYAKYGITVTGPEQLHGIDVDLNHMPDMAQTLAVAAIFANGTTIIRNVGNLRVKETDRLAALQNELTKLGAKVKIQGDDLHVRMAKPGKLHPATIETYDDHRMAMSFAVAGLRHEGVRIADPDCVNKTFPQFWDYLDRLRQASEHRHPERSQP